MKKSYYSVALNTSINCDLFIEEYPAISFSLAIAFKSVTVNSSILISSFCGSNNNLL
jgi:hypothetical protein